MNSLSELSASELMQANTLNRFFQSAEWLYISTRYSKPMRGLLLRALVLSGLSPTAWGSCLMALVRAQHATPLGTLLAPLKDTALATTQARVQDLVVALQRYAEAKQIVIELPLPAPAFLAVFGYSQVDYLADLQQVAGLYPIPEVYFTPWPAAGEEFLQTLEYLDGCHTPFARKTIALMGITANRIEQIVQQGINQMRKPPGREDGNDH